MAKKIMRKGQGLATKHLGTRISKFSAEARRTVTSKTPVRRIQVKDPSRAVTDERIAKQITNNPNLKYQPTGVGPQSAKEVRVPTAPKTFMSGRGKQIRRVVTKIKRR